MVRFIFFIIVITLVSSCRQDRKKVEAEQIVSEWVDKEIRFPDEYVCDFGGKDTASVKCMELVEKEYKILLYVDSTGCTACKLRLPEWNRLIKEAGSLPANKLSFLLFFHPKNKKELQLLFKRDQFDYPVFIDENNALDSLNHFPMQPRYQCFLLGRDNKVMLIGNPVLNLKIWELYKQTIFGQTQTATKTERISETSVVVEQSEIEISGLRVKKKSVSVFRLKNIGNQPLLIFRVDASCGCTVPSWDKRPIKPEEESKITVEIQPEEIGAFHKTVWVYCNVEKEVIALSIKGDVKK
jgi:hypothetical protein